MLRPFHLAAALVALALCCFAPAQAAQTALHHQTVHAGAKPAPDRHSTVHKKKAGGHQHAKRARRTKTAHAKAQHTKKPPHHHVRVHKRTVETAR